MEASALLKSKVVWVVAAAVVIAIVVFLVSGGSRSRLVGTWEYRLDGRTHTIELLSDGTLISGGGGITTWNADSGRLVLRFGNPSWPLHGAWNYSISGSTLTLENDSGSTTHILTRR